MKRRLMFTVLFVVAAAGVAAQEPGRVATAEDAARARLECRTAEATSTITRGPDVTANIPSEAGAGWSVTGGGCQTHFNGHWPPVSYSGPTGTGWRCKGEDPPNIPLTFSITARAIYCRVR
jgi:hypothetical protein